MDTAEIVSTLLEQHEMTQSALAEEMGITRQALSNKMTGIRSFTLKDMKALAIIFDVSIDYVAGRIDTVAGSMGRKGGQMNDIRKACVEAIFKEFENESDAIRPACGDGWGEIEARRSLGHIVGYVDLDVADLVDIVIDTINKEL